MGAIAICGPFRQGRARSSNPCHSANSHFTRQTTVTHTFASVSNALFNGPPNAKGGSPVHKLTSAKDFSRSTSVRIPESLCPVGQAVSAATARPNGECRRTLSVRLNYPEPRPTKLTVRTSECRERECERHPRARRSGGCDWRVGTRLTTP